MHLTRDFGKALRFIRMWTQQQSNWNASTRFTDGNQYGLREQKSELPRRRFMLATNGVEHLTTIKYFVLGRGHIRE